MASMDSLASRGRCLGLVMVLGAGCGGGGPSGDAGSGGASEVSSSSSSSGLGVSETGQTPTTGAPGGTTGATSSSGGLAETSGGDSMADTCACSFLCDCLTADPNVTCDIFVQDCPEGQKCSAFSEPGTGPFESTRCVPVTGDQAPGEACSVEGDPEGGVDDCSVGTMCWFVDADAQGTCVALCTGTLDAPMCAAADHRCVAHGSVLRLCLGGCDPLVQDCPGDALCIPAGPGFVCDIDGSGAEGQVNDPCELPNACDEGLACLDSMQASSACDPLFIGCCEPFCEFPDSACPNPDQGCVQWFDPSKLPDDDPKLAIGVCVIAP